MHDSPDAFVVPFRRPRGWVPAALAVAAGLLAAVVASSAIRTASLIPPEPEVLLQATELPSLPQVFAALSQPREAAPDPPPLPAEWDGIRDPAERQFLARTLDAVARVPPDAVLKSDFLVRSLIPMGRAARDLRARGEIADYGPDTDAWIGVGRYEQLLGVALTVENERRRVAAESAHTEYELARRRARVPQGWALLALLAAAAVPLGAAIHRQLRFQPVLVDGHALRSGRLRLLWEDLAEVRWSADHVEVVRRDGQRSRLDGLDLIDFDIKALQRASDRLVRHRAEGAATAEGADDLAALIGRAGR